MNSINPLEGDFLSKDDLDPVKDGEYLGPDRTPIHINQSVDPSDVIKTTQGIRLRILKSRFAKGIPEDDKELSLNMQLLRDLDSAALTTRKIDVEERSISESERLANANNELLRMLGGKNPFMVDVGTMPAISKREVPNLPEPQLVPDITTQGTQPVEYDDFVQSVEASERAMREDREDEN
ncbi:hypothetical protein D3C87_981640 [compost metagenome]